MFFHANVRSHGHCRLRRKILSISSGLTQGFQTFVPTFQIRIDNVGSSQNTGIDVVQGKWSVGHAGRVQVAGVDSGDTFVKVVIARRSCGSTGGGTGNLVVGRRFQRACGEIVFFVEAAQKVTLVVGRVRKRSFILLLYATEKSSFRHASRLFRWGCFTSCTVCKLLSSVSADLCE